MFFAGYDENNNYAEVWRPVSELGNTLVAVKRDADGKIVEKKRYSVSEENGVYTIVNISESATEVAADTATIPAKYVIQDENGNITATISADAMEGNDEIIKKSFNDQNGNKAGMHVADGAYYTYSDIQPTVNESDVYANVDALKATAGSESDQKRYVKSGSDQDVSYATEELPTGKYLTESETHEEEFTSQNGGIKAAIDLYNTLIESEDPVTKQSATIKYRVFNNWYTFDQFWDIPGVITGSVFDKIVKFFGGKEKNFKVEYKQTETTEVQTDTPETKDFTGLLVESYDQYDEYVWTKKTDAQAPVTKVDNQYYMKNKNNRMSLGKDASETAINNKKEEIIAAMKSKYGDNAQVTVKTEMCTKHIYFRYTVIIPGKEAEYEWVKQENTVTSTTSKIMYNSKDYSYVAEDTKQLSAYYNLGYANGTGSVLNNGDDEDSYDKQRVYNSAKATLDNAELTFAETEKAYAKAKKELEEAQSALDNFAELQLAGRTKKEYVDKYNDAKIAFDKASTNKQDAEAALIAAQNAKEDAEIAFNNANLAKNAADLALGRADDAKRAADDERNASDDDTPSTGGRDDTTFIPGSNVAAPRANALVADDGAAVLGKVRRTATKNSVRKASTSEDTTVAGNADEVKAAPAAEETKTPKAPKAETEITDNETALAATPELEEKGFAWWWLLILAAIAGVSVEEYARRKSNKAKAESNNNINE